MVDLARANRAFSMFQKKREFSRRFKAENFKSGLDEIVYGATDFLIKCGGESTTINEKMEYSDYLNSTMCYTLKDIEDFAGRIHQFKDHKKFSSLGAYVSSLVNNKIKHNQKVVFSPKDENLSLIHLCHNHTKGEFIYTNEAGDYACQLMKGGTFKANGTGDASFLFMSGGYAEITGNVGHDICEEMTGGHIKIVGNVGRCAGEHMEKGKLEIIGSADEETLGRFKMSSAKIKYNGKFI